MKNRITVNKVKARLIIAALVFAGMVLAFWVGSSHSAIAIGLGSYFHEHLRRSLCCWLLYGLLVSKWLRGWSLYRPT